MKLLASINFNARIVSEFSATPTPHHLGMHGSVMELFASEKPDYFFIEWDILGIDEVVEYGIWTENKVLTDYDGGFSLPKQAIQLLRDNGITVPVEFE